MDENGQWFSTPVFFLRKSGNDVAHRAVFLKNVLCLEKSEAMSYTAAFINVCIRGKYFKMKEKSMEKFLQKKIRLFLHFFIDNTNNFYQSLNWIH